MIDSSFFNGKKNLHFVGIGGSGMFPIVQIFKDKGFNITGSDNNESDTLALERSMGIKILLGHKAENIKGADAVIYSAAIMKDNPELLAAEQNGIPAIERSDILGYITKQYSDCVCVSGTHGKTTTTAMLTHMLIKAGIDPSAVIGGKLPLIGGNGRSGASSVMTCEACEFVDTFLKLSPDISIILNIDEDHLDYFKNLDNIIRSFNKFANLTSRTLIVNGDDPNTMRAVEHVDKKIITFGFGPQNDYYPLNITKVSAVSSRFDLMHKGVKLAEITLNVPGRHNITNAVSACIAALELGLSPEELSGCIKDFTGAGRRFEILGHINGATIADDYAHHPLELEVTLNTAKQMGFNNIWAVFQPFTFSRTFLLLEDFARVLSTADKVVMPPIMGAREVNTYGIYTEDLAGKIPGSVHFETFEEIAEYVTANVEPGDLVLTMGCGDIYKCAKIILGLK